MSAPDLGPIVTDGRRQICEALLGRTTTDGVDRKESHRWRNRHRCGLIAARRSLGETGLTPEQPDYVRIQVNLVKYCCWDCQASSR